jgi:dihydroxyacetone kinase-like predicted kinase
VLVVGEPEMVKVHVHTDDPPRVLALASTFGRLDRLSVGDMSTQHRRLRQEATVGAASLSAAAPAPSQEPPAVGQQRANGVGVVAVVSGQGLVRIFRGLGADATVEGGQTMNPSTQDMLAAVESVPYQEVVLLPNNRNVVLAARQVPGLTAKKVHVVATENVPQGIAAVVAFNPERPAAENLALMREAGAHVQAIEVTHAVRDSRSNGLRVKKGDVIALINDKLKHAGADYGSVIQDALSAIGAANYELVTIYRGLQATDSDAEKLGAAIRGSFPGLEVELQAGGQEHYPFILSVE